MYDVLMSNIVTHIRSDKNGGLLFLQSGSNVKRMRQKWHALLLRKLKNPSKAFTESDDVSRVLTSYQLVTKFCKISIHFLSI